MNTGYDNYRPEVHKSEEQWREELTPQEFQVLRKAGTERPYTGQYRCLSVPGVWPRAVHQH